MRSRLLLLLLVVVVVAVVDREIEIVIATAAAVVMKLNEPTNKRFHLPSPPSRCVQRRGVPSRLGVRETSY